MADDIAKAKASGGVAKRKNNGEKRRERRRRNEMLRVILAPPLLTSFASLFCTHTACLFLYITYLLYGRLKVASACLPARHIPHLACHFLTTPATACLPAHTSPPPALPACLPATTAATACLLPLPCLPARATACHLRYLLPPHTAPPHPRTTTPACLPPATRHLPACTCLLPACRTTCCLPLLRAPHCRRAACCCARTACTAYRHLLLIW